MTTPYKTIIAVITLIIIIFGARYFANKNVAHMQLNSTPQNVTLSGTYVCLPHLDESGPQTEECAFGLKTDDNVYYAVNFGASADAMTQFQSGAHITAEGFVVIKEALSSNQWQKYNMKGIFTITQIIPSSTVSGKLNIDVVCQSALAYMTFPDSVAAQAFVQECREGKHPEVIERFKADMNLGDGAQI